MQVLIEHERARNLEKAFKKNKILFHFIDKKSAPVNWKVWKDHIYKNETLSIDADKPYYFILGKVENLKRSIKGFFDFKDLENNICQVL